MKFYNESDDVNPELAIYLNSSLNHHGGGVSIPYVYNQHGGGASNPISHNQHGGGASKPSEINPQPGDENKPEDKTKADNLYNFLSDNKKYVYIGVGAFILLLFIIGIVTKSK